MYLVDVPPPTISGILHIGHIFSYTQMDIIVQYQKLLGKSLLYPFCWDNNGLPTEKLANDNGIINFQAIIDFSNEFSAKYKELFDAIGIEYSPHQYFTFDQNAIDICNLSFQDLVNKGLCYKEETEYYFCPKTQMSVSQSEIDKNGCFERSGEKAILRKGEGWFINLRDHLTDIRKMIDDIEWHPDKFRNRLHRWLDDLKYDWSISRERNFGIPIPGEETLKFDTWFISSLTPQLAWCSHTNQPSLEIPVFDARFQAHDIIRTWAFYTIVKSYYHNNQIPWKHIFISGHALDKRNEKISKSKGNFVSPFDYIDKYGMNGVRYWVALSGIIGNDVNLNEAFMSKGRKFVNKVKNAEKFVAIQKEKHNNNSLNDELINEWNHILSEYHTCMQENRLNEALNLMVDFFWHKLCDVWIEEDKKNNGSYTCSLEYIIREFKQIISPFVKLKLEV